MTRNTSLPEDRSTVARARARVGRHLRWARGEGIARLIEEDQLDPRERIGLAYRKAQWRRTHSVAAGSAQAVFVFGVQRSGTNMVLRGLESAPEVEVHNENDRKVFTRFRLRDDEVVRRVVDQSGHRLVLFKPLIDSHQARRLLDQLPLSSPPLAIWAYRGVDGRARSAVAKFGDVNRQVLSEIAAGRGSGRWQAQGLNAETLDFIASLQPSELSPESAAALFWWARNQLLYDQGLDTRADVHVVSYEQVVADPAATMQPLVQFVGLPWDERFVEHVDARSVTDRPPLELDPRVRAVCDELEARLYATAMQHLARVG